MIRTVRLLLSMAALGLAAACGDDDDDNGDVVEETQCRGVYAGWTEDQLSDATAEGGACKEDTEAICSRDMNAAAGECAQACFIQHGNDMQALIACAFQCVKQGSTIEPSDACLSCYLTAVLCAQQNCLEECLADTGSSSCIQCRAEEGCTGDFLDCSGLPNPAELP